MEVYRPDKWALFHHLWKQNSLLHQFFIQRTGITVSTTTSQYGIYYGFIACSDVQKHTLSIDVHAADLKLVHWYGIVNGPLWIRDGKVVILTGYTFLFNCTQFYELINPNIVQGNGDGSAINIWNLICCNCNWYCANYRCCYTVHLALVS